MEQASRALTFSGRTDSWAQGLIQDVGGIALLTGDIFARGLRRIEWKLLLQQLDHLGWRSLTIVNLTAIFTGMVMTLQMGIFLVPFGAKIYINRVVGLAILRELGPVLTALMIGGRVGAGIAAELGSMAVTEQLDAMRALGADPVRKLVVPRMLALLIVLPTLTILADALGILGSYVISTGELQVDSTFYFSSLFLWLWFGDILSGLGKSLFFAYFIGIIACYIGMNVTGGADGVGRATTRTVVACSITILISDFFLTKAFWMLP